MCILQCNKHLISRYCFKLLIYLALNLKNIRICVLYLQERFSMYWVFSCLNVNIKRFVLHSGIGCIQFTGIFRIWEQTFYKYNLRNQVLPGFHVFVMYIAKYFVCYRLGVARVTVHLSADIV